jgi:large subunit ribosomal protein L13
MKFIDGKGAVLGRLATHVAKKLLMGEEVRIFNCDEIIITGNKKSTEKAFDIKRGRVGHSQKGPKHHSTTEKIVKRAIRGMLPNHREGRGKEAFKRVRCYATIPKEFADVQAEKFDTGKKIKFAEVKNFTKKN